jgi:hypothetical protein
VTVPSGQRHPKKMIFAGNATHPEKLQQIILAASTPPYFLAAPTNGYNNYYLHTNGPKLIFL